MSTFPEKAVRAIRNKRQDEDHAVRRELLQVKTGAYVWLPAHKNLREHLAQTGIGGEYLLSKRAGGAYSAVRLGHLISEACAAAGFPGTPRMG